MSPSSAGGAIPRRFHSLCCWLLLMIIQASPLAATSNVLRRLQPVVVGGFVFPEDCFNSIVDADEDGDGAITAQEFVAFASTYTKSSLGNSFADLPAAFIATFNRLAWDCSSCTTEDDPECCQANGSLEVPDSVNEVDYDLCRSTINASTATPSPTRTPTIMPTDTPTVSPTLVPTASPVTPAPQIVPTTPVPTDTPTLAPTSGAPTAAPTSVETISLAYDIAIRDGMTLFDGPDRDVFTNEYQANLLNAVNDIVEAAIVSTTSRSRRYLAVTIVQPATLSLTELDACRTDTSYAPTDTDICERVEHEVQLRVADTAEATSTELAFTEALAEELQLVLDQRPWSNVVDNTNPLVVLSFLGGRRLGGGAIGGIAAAAALSLLIPAAYLLYRQKQTNEKKEDEPVDDEDDDEEMGASMDTSVEPLITNTSSTLGATNPDYGKGDVLAEPGLLDGDDASSNAGSSGWSSSAGISSLNTGSMDEEGATLTGIGVASAFSRNLGEETDDSETPSRDQLDALIESGDWAAVGATAALLAAASDSQSERSSKVDSVAGDNENVAELDDLVDAGDWEGVVAAAAKFEASAGTGSQSRTTTNSMESTGTGQSTLSNSAGDTPSKVQKREEVRAEVEALVRRVVPDEIDNVDEMMNQFKGREEELVETLRTMQERAVAQKARSAGHKAAKQEARRNVQRGGKGSVIKKVTKLEIQEASAGNGGKQKAGQGMSDAANLKENPRSALEEAIEAGDWEAVGEAAAMISDSSVTTASTAEIQRLAETNLSISTSGTSRSSRANMSGVQAERAVELDQLIDSGDWTAVMAAAKGYSDTDRKDAAAGSRSKEEEEALKEAEHWMKIAEKTKGSNTGASDAAEWAIQRSLTKLKKADKKSEAKSGEDEV